MMEAAYRASSLYSAGHSRRATKDVPLRKFIPHRHHKRLTFQLRRAVVRAVAVGTEFMGVGPFAVR